MESEIKSVIFAFRIIDVVHDLKKHIVCARLLTRQIKTINVAVTVPPVKFVTVIILVDEIFQKAFALEIFDSIIVKPIDLKSF